jgi:hypothetical protein
MFLWKRSLYMARRLDIRYQVCLFSCGYVEWSLKEWREAFIYGCVQAGVQEKLDLV